MTTHEIAIRLREMRRRAGLTQAGLADRTGLNMKSISTWENGRAGRLQIEQLTRICGACGLTPLQFFAFDLEADDLSLDPEKFAGALGFEIYVLKGERYLFAGEAA